MINLLRIILGEKLLKKRREELLNGLLIWFSKFFGVIAAIFLPLVFFSVIPITVNGVKYVGWEGAYYMALMLGICLLVFPFIFYFLIETGRE